ncbi:hypothetical protein KW784_00740 [Candidatus Parcubacteria bacterium]|nr:hypothetical protein [Candidatus Parcubacteria bacterium]
MFRQFQKLQRATGNFFGILLFLTVALLGSTAYLGKTVYDMRKPALSAEAQVRKLVEEVGQAIILPQDELPTVAKVADASQLSDQPFFANARTGDNILIFEKSKKAVLWRPSVRRVVEVSSLAAAAASVPKPEEVKKVSGQ